jgi:hypothetical protein
MPGASERPAACHVHGGLREAAEGSKALAERAGDTAPQVAGRRGSIARSAAPIGQDVAIMARAGILPAASDGPRPCQGTDGSPAKAMATSDSS